MPATMSGMRPRSSFHCPSGTFPKRSSMASRTWRRRTRAGSMSFANSRTKSRRSSNGRSEAGEDSDDPAGHWWVLSSASQRSGMVMRESAGSPPKTPEPKSRMSFSKNSSSTPKHSGISWSKGSSKKESAEKERESARVASNSPFSRAISGSETSNNWNCSSSMTSLKTRISFSGGTPGADAASAFHRACRAPFAAWQICCISSSCLRENTSLRPAKRTMDLSERRWGTPWDLSRSRWRTRARLSLPVRISSSPSSSAGRAPRASLSRRAIRARAAWPKVGEERQESLAWRPSMRRAPRFQLQAETTFGDVIEEHVAQPLDSQLKRSRHQRRRRRH
mmetsp:Transcript_40083/g.126224  ORF Transcript_40083/g.126224 Transcript_40083/m.126224 type:complete len:336 (-) Transcript_40083:46-1053(-)